MRFGGLFTLREVYVGRDLYAGVALTNDRGEDVIDAFDGTRLDFTNVLNLRWVEASVHKRAF